MTFMEKLERAWASSGSLLCVGLDPDPAKLPVCLKGESHPVFAFNKAIIDATHPFVCCYKPQIAYYSGAGMDEDLMMTLDYLRTAYPVIPVILDAKRADIGATTSMYAREAFERYNADAVTVNPYMGMDAIQPFLDHAERGVIILCRTSNAGGKEIQDLELASGEKLFLHVAKLASGPWNYNRNVALVAGATYPEELGMIRSIAGNVPLLVPGIGAQGGDVEKVLKNGLTPAGTGLMINSSRGIIYAGKDENFGKAAGEAAEKLSKLINSYR